MAVDEVQNVDLDILSTMKITLSKVHWYFILPFYFPMYLRCVPIHSHKSFSKSSLGQVKNSKSHGLNR